MRRRLWSVTGSAVLVGVLAAGLPVLYRHARAADASDKPPEIVAGTAKITVTARFRDGKRPVGARCRIGTWAQSQLPSVTDARGRHVFPTVVGKDGNWVIYNVGPGRWVVSVNGDNLAFVRDRNSRSVEFKDTEPMSVTFTLLRGGSITGCVVHADTGDPVIGAHVARGPGREAVTDAEGRYTITHLAPGRSFVTGETDKHFATRSDLVEVRDEATVSVPDIKLRPGGWISGRVVRPEGTPEWILAWGSVMPRAEGERPPNTVISSQRASKDGSFCLGPLPAGTYSVEAWASTGKVVPHKRWRGEVKGIRVQAGKETKGVLIPLSPTKTD